MKLKRVALATAGSLALLAGGTAAGAVIAGGPVSSGVVYACYTTKAASNGTHSVELINQGSKCPSSTTAVTWNQKGQTGATGPAGPQGPQGPPGVADVDRGVVQWTGGGVPDETCTLEQAAGPDASSLSVGNNGSTPANMCWINGLPSGSIVVVSPIGSPSSVGAQQAGFSGGTFEVWTSGSTGEFSFAAFPGS